jgi:hypothetical protein
MTLERHQRQRLEFLTGHAHVPQLVHAAQQMMAQAHKILAKA